MTTKFAKREFRFQSPLVNYALEQTHQELQSQVNDPNGFAQMLNTVLTPFVLAARMVSDLISEIGKCLNTPQLKEYTLRAIPISVNFSANIQASRSEMKQVAQSIVSGVPIGRLSPFYGVWIWGKNQTIVIKPENDSTHFQSQLNFGWNWRPKGDSYLLPGRLLIKYDYVEYPDGQVNQWILLETTDDPNQLKGSYPVRFESTTGKITFPQSSVQPVQVWRWNK